MVDGHFPNFARVGVKDYVIEPNLVQFTKGKKLARWRSWKNYNALYMSVNVKGVYWVCLVIDLV